MSSHCCCLGRAINEERVLCQTSNFFVMPTFGSMSLEGYLLVVSKEHYLGYAQIPSKFHCELDELLTNVKKIIKSEYNKPVLIFEHGPRIGRPSSGQSIDHAHLHIVPGIDITKDWALDLMSRLDSQGLFYRVERVQGLEKGKELLDGALLIFIWKI